MPPMINEDITARMEALIRRLADPSSDPNPSLLQWDAQQVVSLLPEPVDPDLIEARRCWAAQNLHRGTGEDCPIMKGSDDGGWVMTAVLAAIKRGRELASSDNRA